MARDFDGSTGYLTRSSPGVSGPPVTMACWFNADAATASEALMSINVSDRRGFVLTAAGAVAGDPVRFQSITTAGGTGTADSTTGYTAGTWHHAIGTSSLSNSRAAYIDGGSEGTNTTNAPVGTLANIIIGARTVTTPGLFFNGHIAEAAVWNVVLDPAERVMLARGVSPLFVRPSALVSYCPVYGRNGPEVDFKSADTFALTGTAAQSAHPRIIMPSGRRTIYVPTVSGGGGGGTAPLSNRLLSNRLNRTSRIAA